MNNKEARIYRLIRNTIFVMLVGGIPALDINATNRAINALKGQRADCSSGEAANKNYQFDLIAVFGAGTYQDGNGFAQPNTFQRGRLDGAAAAFVKGLAPKILLIDGGLEETVKTSIKYLKGKVDEFSGGRMELLNSSIGVTTRSSDTASNAEDLKRYMEKNRLKKALGITDDFHAPRASLLNCNYGINSRVMSVEDFASDYYPYNVPIITDRNNSFNMAVTKAGEEFKTSTLIWDSLGLIPQEVRDSLP